MLGFSSECFVGALSHNTTMQMPASIEPGRHVDTDEPMPFSVQISILCFLLAVLQALFVHQRVHCSKIAERAA
jgi:hypothetical protein